MAEESGSEIDVKYIDAITSYPINTNVRENILKPLDTDKVHSSPAPKRDAKFFPKKKNISAVIKPRTKRMFEASLRMLTASFLSFFPQRTERMGDSPCPNPIVIILYP